MTSLELPDSDRLQDRDPTTPRRAIGCDFSLIFR